MTHPHEFANDQRASRARARDTGTRQRLLTAARDLFAERGFAKVTVRDITSAANANLAAVSYHFGDKLGLYQEVLELGVQIARELNAETMLPRDAHTAEECLRHYVRTYLPRIVRTDSRMWFHRLMRHEMADPTPVARWFVQQAFMPRLEFLMGVVRDLLGDAATSARVNRTVASIQSQCLFYLPDPFKAAAFGQWAPGSDEEIRDAAEHIIEFSLAGIRAIAEQPRRGPRLRPR